MTAKPGTNWLELGKGLIIIIGAVGGGAGVYSARSTNQDADRVEAISTRLELHAATDSINKVHTLEAISRIEANVKAILEEQKTQGNALLVLVTKMQK